MSSDFEPRDFEPKDLIGMDVLEDAAADELVLVVADDPRGGGARVENRPRQIEQIAQIALNGRRNAGLNPKAVYREPLSLEEYLESRWISTPLRLYDCDVPCDGSTAVIFSVRSLRPRTTRRLRWPGSPG